MTALISHTGTTVAGADFFCGFGGSSQGIKAAGAEIRVAANHNKLAIECHAANFPDVDHYRADLVDPESGDYMDVASLPGASFAWFSPGCTHHSPANSKKIYMRGRQASLFGDEEEFDYAAYAESERSRVTMSCVLRYAEKHKAVLQCLVVENVVEVTLWGDDRDGSTFAWWKRTLEKIGYEVECLFLNSQFFPPCPQSRDRIYIVAWRKGNKRPNLDYRPVAYCASDRCGGRIVNAVQSWKPRTKNWPMPKWGKYGRQYVYRCPDCDAQVDPAAWPAYTAINWNNLGRSLGERLERGMKPLAAATVERIRRAMAKFSAGPSMVIPAKSTWGTDRVVLEPFTAQTTQQDKALVTAIIKNNGSQDEAKYRGVSPIAPLGALTANPAQALATAAAIPQRMHVLPRSAYDQMNALTTSGGGGQAFAAMLVPQRSHNLPVSTFEQLNALATHADQAVAVVPSLVEMRGGGSVLSGQHSVMEATHTVTAGGGHHGLVSTPFLLNGQGNDSARSVTESGYTVRTDGGMPFVSPALFAKINGGPSDTAWHALSDPLNTVTAHDTHGLLMLPCIDQFMLDPAGVTEQLATVMTHLRRALDSTPELPLEAITEDDLMRSRFRMLEPDPELRRAMAFADDYILIGNKGQITAGLGNAVTPPVAEWITERCLATLR